MKHRNLLLAALAALMPLVAMFAPIPAHSQTGVRTIDVVRLCTENPPDPLACKLLLKRNIGTLGFSYVRAMWGELADLAKNARDPATGEQAQQLLAAWNDDLGVERRRSLLATQAARLTDALENKLLACPVSPAGGCNALNRALLGQTLDLLATDQSGNLGLLAKIRQEIALTP